MTTYTHEQIKEMLEQLGTEWYATYWAMDDPEYDYCKEEHVWTLSKIPNRLGWENDGNCVGYGLPQDIAKSFAAAPAIIRQLLGENEKLKKVAEVAKDVYYAYIESTPNDVDFDWGEWGNRAEEALKHLGGKE